MDQSNHFTLISRTVPFRSALLALVMAFASIMPAAPLAAEDAPASGPRLERLDAYLRAFMKANGVPGLSLAVVKDGKTVFVRGYGKAGPGKPMDGETRMRVASLSKSFTALAVLRLVEEGRIGLDDPLRSYAPFLESSVAGAVTVRNLLNQTSGLDESGDPDPNPRGSTLEEEVRSLAAVRPSAPAGTRYRYYNKNYRALGYIVEKASGRSYPEFLRREVFAPLGMEGATAASDAEGIASGHMPFFGIPLTVRTPESPGEAPAGGLVLSAADMAKYLAAYQDAGRGKGSVVSPAILAIMKESPQEVESRYGMGWRIEEHGSRIIHGGDCEGFSALAEIDEKTGVAYALFFNMNGVLMKRAGSLSPSSPSPFWLSWTKRASTRGFRPGSQRRPAASVPSTR